MKTINGLVLPLQKHWKIRSKTLAADLNVFGANMPGRSAGHHWGWDLEAPIGTSVHAVGPGTVKFAESVTGYGNVVTHGFHFHDKTFWAVYAHLSEIDVKSGEKVEAGQVIGLTGVSGNADTSDPHLHLEFHDSAALTKGALGKVDPKNFFGKAPIEAPI